MSYDILARVYMYLPAQGINRYRVVSSMYHPLWGYYKSDDPAILKKQIDAMKRAKIDVVGYDVFPTCNGFQFSGD